MPGETAIQGSIQGSIFSTISQYASPTVLGVAALGTAAAIGAVLYLKKLNSLDQKIRNIFEKLQISEWNLPGISSSYNLVTDLPKPIFNARIESEIAKLKSLIKKALHGEENKKPSLPNIIVCGRAGVGKTMLLEDLCRRSEVGFIRMPSGAMESHLKTGTHIVAFHEVLKIAEQSNVDTYIIMDDGEELLATRPAIQQANVQAETTKAPWLVEQERMSETIAKRRIALVNAILEESGKEYRRVAFGVTSNREFVVDPAFKTRARILTIDPPGFQERKNIIITHLPIVFQNDKIYLCFFDKGRLEKMALSTEGFTGRNIVKMLEDIHACVQLQNGDITQDIIDASIVAMKKSVEEANRVKTPVQEATVSDAQEVSYGKVAAVHLKKVLFNIYDFGRTLFSRSNSTPAAQQQETPKESVATIPETTQEAAEAAPATA